VQIGLLIIYLHSPASLLNTSEYVSHQHNIE